MTTYLVAEVIGKYREEYGGCDCAACRRNRKPKVIHPAKLICDTDPVKRTVQYHHLSDAHPGSAALNGYHHLTLPFVRTVIGVYKSETADVDVFSYSWDGNIQVFGSLEPYTDLDQPVFAMPLPNLDGTGSLTCNGEMKNMVFSGQRSKEELCQQVVNAFWTTSFAYWSNTWPTGNDFKVLQGGMSTLSTLKANTKLANFVS